MPNERLDPETVRAWQRIGRDVASSFVGCFLCVYGAITVSDPTLLTVMLGGGLTLLGLAPALRIDEKIRGRNGNGNGGGE